MSTTELGTDLNATIASAVQARIEASVAEALAGGELIGQMVRAALNQTVEVPNSTGYGKERVPFLRSVLYKTIQQATINAVQEQLVAEQPLIEAEVRKALKRDAADIATSLVGNLAERAQTAYGVRIGEVQVVLPGTD